METIVRKFGYSTAVMCIAIGVILKIMHFQYAELLFALGVLLLLSTLTYLFIKKNPKSFLEVAKFITLTFLILSILFTVLRWPYSYYLVWVFYISMSTYIITALYKLALSNSESTNKIKPNLYTFSIAAVILGVLFIIMNWVNGVFILGAGILLLTIVFIVDRLKR